MQPLIRLNHAEEMGVSAIAQQPVGFAASFGTVGRRSLALSANDDTDGEMIFDGDHDSGLRRADAEVMRWAGLLLICGLATVLFGVVETLTPARVNGGSVAAAFSSMTITFSSAAFTALAVGTIVSLCAGLSIARAIRSSMHQNCSGRTQLVIHLIQALQVSIRRIRSDNQVEIAYRESHNLILTAMLSLRPMTFYGSFGAFLGWYNLTRSKHTNHEWLIDLDRQLEEVISKLNRLISEY